MTADSPQPLYLIGDCHVDALHGARVLDEQQNTLAFGTKFHISGINACEFLDSSGRINPKIVTALVGFQALHLDADFGVNEPIIDESLLAPNIFAKSFRLNRHVVINPAVDRATFLNTGHRERLTPAGIGAGSISNV